MLYRYRAAIGYAGFIAFSCAMGLAAFAYVLYDISFGDYAVIMGAIAVCISLFLCFCTYIQDSSRRVSRAAYRHALLEWEMSQHAAAMAERSEAWQG